MKRSFRHIGKKIGIGAVNPRVCPTVKYVTMEWRGVFPLSIITGSLQFGGAVFLSDYKYRANSVYDPLFSSAGTYNTSANWYDFYKNLYNKYEVIKSSCTIKLKQRSNLMETNTVPVRWGILMDDDGLITPYTHWRELVAEPHGVHGVWHPNNNGDAEAKLRNTFTEGRWFMGNRPWNVTAMGSNPAKVVFYMFWYQVEDESTPGHAIQFNLDVYVRYRVRLTDPKDQASYQTATFDVVGPNGLG